MKLNFRVIGKIALLLVVIGFFMPVACDQNGFQLAETFTETDSTISSVFLYVLFISSLA
jgi:glucose uptake protein GlcU